MTEVENKLAQELNDDASLNKTAKRKHDADSEDELFFKFENESKKRISEEFNDNKEKSNEEKKDLLEEKENNVNDSAVKKVNEVESKATSSPLPKQNGNMIQGKINFFKKTVTESPKAKTELLPVPVRANGEWEIQDYLLDSDWKNLLSAEFNKKYFQDINKFIKDGYKRNINRPPKELVFNAFNSTKLNQIKVVIIGQDPYHDDGQAHGLAFSVPKDIRLPPSLKNIFTELKSDIPEFERDEKLGGCLQKWTQEGVFLLNTFLTVEAHKAGSHSKIGWDIFTDSVIKLISQKNNGCAFLLWGNFAQKKESLIDKKKHKVIKCAHPSPFSVTRFYGSKCFSQANDFLKSINKTPINWSLKE